jgi:hypothetical protein
MAIPLVVWGIAGLIAWRAGDHAGDAVGDAVAKVIPWAAGAAGLYLLTRKG